MVKRRELKRRDNTAIQQHLSYCTRRVHDIVRLHTTTKHSSP